MRVASWSYYGLDPARVVALGLFVSSVAGVLLYAATRAVLGSDAPEVSLALASVVLYLVLSLPKRALGSATLSQATEAPTLAAAVSANLEATHSRTRSVLLLESNDPTIASLLVRAKRDILLGFGVSHSLSRATDRVASQSAKNVLDSIASSEPEMIDEGGEETQGITQASRLSEESQLPLFMAVAFFTPILLILYAVLSHVTEPGGFAGLVIVQLVVLDVAFYVSSAERKKLS